MSHDRDWHDSWLCTRHDRRDRWLWRLVGRLIHSHDRMMSEVNPWFLLGPTRRHSAMPAITPKKDNARGNASCRIRKLQNAAICSACVCGFAHDPQERESVKPHAKSVMAAMAKTDPATRTIERARTRICRRWGVMLRLILPNVKDEPRHELARFLALQES